MIDSVCKNSIIKTSESKWKTERYGNGEEVGRSVRKNRVMKDRNLQKWMSDKAKIKM